MKISSPSILFYVSTCTSKTRVIWFNRVFSIHKLHLYKPKSLIKSSIGDSKLEMQMLEDGNEKLKTVTKVLHDFQAKVSEPLPWIRQFKLS